MERRQASLFSRTSHANLGKAWESELIAVHDLYRMQGRADIVKNPSEWVFIGGRNARNASARHDPRMLATTDNGQRMIRTSSDVDFSGGGKSFSVCFDAKSCEANTFPLSSVASHQIRRLVQSSRCGTIAGLMVRMVKFDRVFFVPATYLNERSIALLKQTGRRAKPGTASISIAAFEEHGAEIPRDINGLWNWLSILT